MNRQLSTGPARWGDAYPRTGVREPRHSGRSRRRLSTHRAGVITQIPAFAWRARDGPAMAICRCLLRECGHEARLTLMLSHRANVASIVSRRAGQARLGDLIKSPIA